MTGSGTATDPYIISTVTDLQNIDNDLTAYYELGGDIDASAGITPIAYGSSFTGQLDGKGYAITGMVTTTSASALFYANGGTIQNLGVTDCVVSGASGGAIAYKNTGTITKCYATGTVTCTSSMAGLVQWNAGGTITNCYSRVNLVGDGVCSGGGLVQWNQTGTIDDCYSTGSFTDISSKGGLVQYNTGTVTNCFWDTEASGESDSDAGTGKTTAEMKTESIFTDAGWNFATIWHMDGVTNNAYPFLGMGAVILIHDSIARVSSIRHIFQPSIFRMQVALGELGFDVDVAETTIRKTLDTAKDIEEPPAEPVVTKPTDIPPQPTEVAPPEPGELTEYAKKILAKPAARALMARVTGIRQGVEAVVTPYAIDVLMQKELEATKVIELQRIQKSAVAPGITDYARQVLEKRAIQIKQELEGLYRSRR